MQIEFSDPAPKPLIQYLCTPGSIGYSSPPQLTCGNNFRSAASVRAIFTINIKPIAVLTALLLFVAIHACYVLSASLGIVEWCLPYIDGCTSISRASRSQPTIFLFRAMMMPAALGVFACVLLMQHWLTSLGVPRDAGMNLIVVFGLLAAAGLLVYCVFLGTGSLFRPYRRISVICFLGFFLITQLFVTSKLSRLMREGAGIPGMKRILQAMVAVVIAQVLLGAVNIAVVPFMENNDAIENAIEWNVCGLMIAYFLLTYAGWRVTGFNGALSIELDAKTQPS